MSTVWGWPRIVASGMVAALVLVSTACGDDDPGLDAGGDGVVTATYRYEGEADQDQLQAAIAARLDGAGMDGSEVDAPTPGTVRVRVRDGDPGAIEAALSALEQPGELTFRPVLRTDAEVPTVMQAGPVDEPAVLPAAQPAPGDPIAYEVGPAGTTADIVETASPERSPGGTWAVRVVLTVEGLAPFNALALQCNAVTERCPTGQLAIVLDGVVLSAPVVSQPQYERDQIQITPGDADEAFVRRLAAALSGGVLPVRLERTA